MIVSRMDGGLGNQMFQYAFGLYLAQRHHTQLWLDISSYDQGPQHGYLLDRFQIESDALPERLMSRVPRRYRKGRASWIDRLADTFQLGNLARYKQTRFGFETESLQVPDNRYLVGYWQSEKYFPGLRDALLQHFQFRDPAGEKSHRIAEKILSSNSAAIHVRRGDYLKGAAASLYQNLDLGYYRSRLEDWAASKSDVQVFVFSNDMEWCRKNLHLPWPVHWVDHNGTDTAHEDVWLMSQAACNVIANSTLSWWAAWLNRRRERVVYAPPVWFRKESMDEEHLLPREWIRQIDPQKAAAA